MVLLRNSNGIWSNERATWCTYACGTFCIDNGSISVMNKDKTFCYSSITFSDLLKQVQKYRIIGTYAVGYQPTLATEMGQLQERITSTNKGSVTSIQAVFVPPMTILTRQNCIRSLRCYN